MDHLKRGCHDDQADTYDEKVLADLDDYVRENYYCILTRIVELLDLREAMAVLDIGIGTGLLVERMPEDIELYGIDISKKMMRKLEEKGLKANLAYGSFLNIPYENGMFDRIVSSFAFHHLTEEEKEEAFKEMDRVLKDTGVIVIGDFMFKDCLQKREVVERLKSESRVDILEDMAEEYPGRIDRSIEVLRKLGFTVEYERGSTLAWILKARR